MLLFHSKDGCFVIEDLTLCVLPLVSGRRSWKNSESWNSHVDQAECYASFGILQVASWKLTAGATSRVIIHRKSIFQLLFGRVYVSFQASMANNPAESPAETQQSLHHFRREMLLFTPLARTKSLSWSLVSIALLHTRRPAGHQQKN